MIFSQHPSKTTMETLQRKIMCDANRTNNSNFFKVPHRGIKCFLKFAPTFLFLILIKLKAFRVTQNETPKMVKFSTSTNKLSKKSRNMSVYSFHPDHYGIIHYCLYCNSLFLGLYVLPVYHSLHSLLLY